MTEEEILEVGTLVNAPFPFLYHLPYDVGDWDATLAYYEQEVGPDLWSSLNLLMDMLARVERDHANPQFVRDHLGNYLSAIHRLAPDEYLIKIEPYLDDPKLRLTLFTSISLNHAYLKHSPASLQWLNPWINRLDQLTEEEIIWLIEEFGQTHEHLKEESIQLLHQVRSQISGESSEVQKALEFSFGRLM